MKIKSLNCIVTIAVLLLFSAKISIAQSGYEMKEGETIMLDENGKIINEKPTLKKSFSNNDVIIKEVGTINKKYIYNADGTLKLPGYIPIGNAQVDEQNYKKAKYDLYVNNPEEYKKISKSIDTQPIIRISKIEFEKFPENKKQYILGHPEKYYIDEVIKGSENK